MHDYPPVPPDDLQRHITLAQPDKDQNLPHIGIVGDTYTILFTGDDTNGRFCLIDMHIPSGGGRCHITGWHSQDFVVNMPIKLQRSPLAMSSALRRETGEVSDGISDDVGR